MPRLRLNYEPRKEAEGCPWGIEMPNGERLYSARVSVEVRAWTVIVPGEPRAHAYLECEGSLIHAQDESRIVACS